MKTYTYRSTLITRNEFGYYYVQGYPVSFKTLGKAKDFIDRMAAQPTTGARGI